MPAPSLLNSCIKACIKNVSNIEDVGSLEYFQIKPILARITSAEQLHRIEQASPQIQGDDAELWQKLIARDIPSWKKKNYAPKNPNNWYKIYCKYMKEQQEEIERDQEVLRATLMGLKKTREEKMSRIEDPKNLPRVPRDPRMIANNGGVPLRGRAGVKHASSLTWTAGSKTKMTDGKSVLNRARKEAKEISARSKLAKPTQDLGGRAGQVTRAPAGMARGYQIAAQPAIKLLTKRRVSGFDIAPRSNPSGPSLEEREKRLRQAMLSRTTGVKRPAEDEVQQRFIDSDDESDSNNLDDIFDSPKKAQNTRPVASSSRPTKPMPSSQLPPSLSTPRALTGNKPSDLISTMLSRKTTNRVTTAVIKPPIEQNTTTEKKPIVNTKPPGRFNASPPPASARTSLPAPPVSRGYSPPSRAQNPPPPGMVRKRKEVDVFNRRPTKRPRSN